MSTERLIEGLWGEDPPPTALAALQGHVSGLRRALGADAIATRRPGYLLAAGPEEIDLTRFEGLRVQARAALDRGDAAVGAASLRAALELWRGEPLADIGSAAFAAGEAARLDDLRLGALEDRIDADLALGGAGELVAELESLVAAHPLRERPRGQLMLALYRAGRQADALDAYRSARRTLVTELGIEPGPALRDLERRILEQDQTLDARRRPGAAAAPRRRRRIAVALAGACAAAAIVVGAILLARGDAAPTVPLNAVAIIDPADDRVTGAISVGREPGPLAPALGGLWVLSTGNRTLSRIDPRKRTLVRTDGVGDAPGNLAATPKDVWVLDRCAIGGDTGGLIHVHNAADGELLRDTSLDGALPREPSRPDPLVLGELCGLAAAGDTVWASTNVPPGLVRVDYDPAAATTRVVRGIPLRTAPTAIAVAAGSVWAVDADADAVLRIDPATGRTLRTVRVGSDPTAIAVGARGVWVANGGDGSVSRIDPRTGAVAKAISVGELPAGLAIGEGSVWVANSGDGTVSRIDPARNRVAGTIQVGHRPQGVAVAGGRVWVTVRP